MRNLFQSIEEKKYRVRSPRAGAERRERGIETYGRFDKAFILHTNCFAEHFVFE